MRHHWEIKALAAAILLFWGMNRIGFTQESGLDLKKEIKEIKQEQQAIRKELQAIKALLLQIAQDHSQESEVDISGIEFELGTSPIMGSNAAKFVLVEFTDYQ
jgi:hypothetical protein